MFPTKRILVAMGLAYCLLNPNIGRAGIVIGPGDTSINSNDTNPATLVVDLVAPMTLAAGTYTADSFNYAFLQTTDGPIGGTIEPLLLTESGGQYEPIAMGDTVTYGAPTAFASHPFGGSGTFTLAASETVYAGLYQVTDGNSAPVGFLDGSGSVFAFGYAAPPAIGEAIGGGLSGTFSRTYDFSIGLASAVPEPSALVLAGTAILAGLGYAWRRSRAIA